MKDWKSIAQALAPDVPADAVSRIAGPLTTLEEAFRPLCADLPSELEPATLFLTDEEGQ
jgi:hypothetical protein